MEPAVLQSLMHKLAMAQRAAPAEPDATKVNRPQTRYSFPIETTHTVETMQARDNELLKLIGPMIGNMDMRQLRNAYREAMQGRPYGGTNSPALEAQGINAENAAGSPRTVLNRRGMMSIVPTDAADRALSQREIGL